MATMTTARAATKQNGGGAVAFAPQDRWAALCTGCAVWGALSAFVNGWATNGVLWVLSARFAEETFLTVWGDWWTGGVALLASVYAAFGSRWFRRLRANRKRPGAVAPVAPGDPKDLHTVWVGGLSSAGEMLAWMPLLPLVALIGSAMELSPGFVARSVFLMIALGVFAFVAALSAVIGPLLCVGVLGRQWGAWMGKNAAPLVGDYIAGAAFLLMLFVGLPAFNEFWKTGFNING